MASRNKDVMVYRYDPRKKYFLASVHLENKPGVLGNLANLLGIRGINILEGHFGGIDGEKGILGFFAESTNERMDAGWLRDFLKSSVGVTDVEVKSGVEGFLTDSLNFPITWNNGDRAVLMRVEGLRAMLSLINPEDPEARKAWVAAIYAQGRSYGRAAWDNLFGVHRPKTREGIVEMLNIYVATGWGRVELMELDPARRKARIGLDQGFECVGLTTGRPEGHFVSGHFAGAMSSYFGEDVESDESKCLSKGDDHCEFAVSPRKE